MGPSLEWPSPLLGAPTYTSAYWWGPFSKASVGCRHWAGLTEPLHSFSWDPALAPLSPESTVGIWVPGQQYQPEKPPGLPPTVCDLNADGHGLDSAELHALGVIQSTVLLRPRHIMGLLRCACPWAMCSPPTASPAFATGNACPGLHCPCGHSGPGAPADQVVQAARTTSPLSPQIPCVLLELRELSLHQVWGDLSPVTAQPAPILSLKFA